MHGDGGLRLTVQLKIPESDCIGAWAAPAPDAEHTTTVPAGGPGPPQRGQADDGAYSCLFQGVSLPFTFGGNGLDRVHPRGRQSGEECRVKAAATAVTLGWRYWRAVTPIRVGAGAGKILISLASKGVGDGMG